MQRDYGQPGTAQTLYGDDGRPRPIARDAVATDGRAGRDVVLAMPVRGWVSNTLVDRRTGRRCNVWCE